MVNFPELHNYLQQEFKLDWRGIHGLPHWSRVYINAKKVAEAERIRDSSIVIFDDVIRLFSFLHDHQRVHDGGDSGHGLRAVMPARKIRGKLFTISDAEMDLLEQAMIGHSDGLVIADPTIMVCWDADRLDLGRVGKTPNPQYLCTESAKNCGIIEKAYLRSIR